jgi:hypothetical protein
MRMDPDGKVWTNLAGGLLNEVTIPITTMTPQYEDGKLASSNSGIHNHHVVFINTSKFVIVHINCGGLVVKSLPGSISMATGENSRST